MPNFGTTSRVRLATAHPELQRLFNEVVKEFDCKILDGHRDAARQMTAFVEGHSKVKWPHSLHNQNPSLAVDVAPWPIRWPDKNRGAFAKDLGRFYMFVGYVKGKAEELGIKIRCGADWNGNNEINDQTFDDLPHFELMSL